MFSLFTYNESRANVVHVTFSVTLSAKPADFVLNIFKKEIYPDSIGVRYDCD